MAANPPNYRRHALRCVNQASNCTSPAASQKLTDLALAWLMLAEQIEERSSSAAAPRQRKGAPEQGAPLGVPRFGSLDHRK
jgi:hypothetical protein